MENPFWNWWFGGTIIFGNIHIGVNIKNIFETTTYSFLIHIYIYFTWNTLGTMQKKEISGNDSL